MKRDKFIEIVVQAVSELPQEFQDLIENVDIVVEDWPTRQQLKMLGLKEPRELFGLYEGIPLTERNQYYNLVLPDKITIFQKPLEAQYSDKDALRLEITRTVRHEIAHFFGLDEDNMDKIERKYNS